MHAVSRASRQSSLKDFRFGLVAFSPSHGARFTSRKAHHSAYDQHIQHIEKMDCGEVVRIVDRAVRGGFMNEVHNAALGHISSTGSHSIYLLGLTGMGKSTMANHLVGYDSLSADEESEIKTLPFEARESLDSVTDVVRMNSIFFLPSQYVIKIVDTPGLEDSEGRSVDFLEKIANYISKDKSRFKTFVFVMKHGSRFDANLKSHLKALHIILGSDFPKNLVIALTHADGASNEKLQKWCEGVRERVTRVLDDEGGWTEQVLPFGKGYENEFCQNLCNFCSRQDAREFHSEILETLQEVQSDQEKRGWFQSAFDVGSKAKKMWDLLSSIKDKFVNAEEKLRQESERAEQQEREEKEKERRELNQRLKDLEEARRNAERRAQNAENTTNASSGGSSQSSSWCNIL